MTEWLGREKSERKGNRFGTARVSQRLRQEEAVYDEPGDHGDSPAAGKGSWGNGLVSKVLPLFKRQTKQVRDLIPELYLHGLASGDFELALRGLVGGRGAAIGDRRYSGSRRNGRENTSSGRARRLRRRTGPIFGRMGFM